MFKSTDHAIVLCMLFVARFLVMHNFSGYFSLLTYSLDSYEIFRRNPDFLFIHCTLDPTCAMSFYTFISSPPRFLLVPHVRRAQKAISNLCIVKLAVFRFNALILVSSDFAGNAQNYRAHTFPTVNSIEPYYLRNFATAERRASNASYRVYFYKLLGVLNVY